ncbi:DUF3012 domain-containing protein [Pseudomaricurvus sp.]|uniref:DUF3012 domain-containing protein n=1 Tax=Pseudomaricurvus sp. TaxID=2004510 RepID=UPI003F6CA266
MKKYLGILCLLLVGLIAVIAGLAMVENKQAPELVGEAWCDAMVDKPNADWTDAETRSFAKACLYNNEDDQESSDLN